MIIRGMKESDIMPLYALEEQCFCLSDRWSMADIRKAYELEHFFVLVAEEAEEICGYCIVYAVMDSADIGKIAGAPKARGKESQEICWNIYGKFVLREESRM